MLLKQTNTNRKVTIPQLDGKKVYKIFIYSLPREFTCEVLTQHFLKYIKQFKVKRSKNKGRKTKIFAILEVYKKSDITVVFANEHFINGKKLNIKPYNKNKNKKMNADKLSRQKSRFDLEKRAKNNEIRRSNIEDAV
jgi:hypothetical protein